MTPTTRPASSTGKWRMRFSVTRRMQSSKRIFRRDRVHRGAHDLRRRRFRGRAAQQDDFTRIVTLGNDTRKRLAIHHQQRADVMVRHQLNGFENGIFRTDGKNGSTLAVEQMSHRDHRCPLLPRG